VGCGGAGNEDKFTVIETVPTLFLSSILHSLGIFINPDGASVFHPDIEPLSCPKNNQSPSFRLLALEKLRQRKPGTGQSHGG